MSKPFRFKQFEVHHSMSTIKVGTDGVLLGSAVQVGNATRILDVGTGCGVIALMLAQRSPAAITGIDIDAASIDEARFNGEQSPWKERLTFLHSSIQDFTQGPIRAFDLIVSNPPFFTDSLHSPSPSKNRAKHNIELNYEDLLACTSQLLKEDGLAWFIIPTDQCNSFQNIARRFALFQKYALTIYPIEGKKANRCIKCYSFEESLTPVHSKVYIRNADRSYTQEYKDLTTEYYLDL